ncbi:hypothetical protein [Azospirillum largimobile]
MAAGRRRLQFRKPSRASGARPVDPKKHAVLWPRTGRPRRPPDFRSSAFRPLSPQSQWIAASWVKTSRAP